jgi:uncharacterized protein (TIGR00266 family)
MQYEIFGGVLPAVEIELNTNQSIYTQSGGMTWMTDGIRMDTNMKGGLMKGLGRALSGDSMFMATYTAERPNAKITIASTFPGTILPVEIKPGQSYICQKSAFLCAQPGIAFEVTLTKGFAGGLFGGEGFILQKLSGEGLAFVEIDGSIKEYTLAQGEKMKVDTGNVAMFESTVSYNVETVKGFTNVLFGGEGLFLTTLVGPGKVWLQTMTVSGLASRIVPFLPMNRGK